MIILTMDKVQIAIGIHVADGLDAPQFLSGRGIPQEDLVIARDLERLEAVRTARAEKAAAYFRANAEEWGRIRSLYVPEDKVEQAMLELGTRDPIEVVADLIRLRSSDQARIVVHVLDPRGNKLFTSPPVAITAEDTAIEIPAFGLLIPGNGAFVDVQVEIIPGEVDEGEPSNAARFAVKGPRSRFSFQAADPVTKGSLDAAVQGATSSALLQVFYTLYTAGGNGTFEFWAEERRRGTNVALSRFGAPALSVPPGKDLQAEQKIDFTFPLPSVPTKTEFFIHILLKDDQGQVVARDSASVNIRSPGQVHFGDRRDEADADDDTPKVSPATIAGGNLVKTGRSYFRPGDDVAALPAQRDD